MNSDEQPYPIDVMGSGAVLLGSEVVCDGFQCSRPVRVQTHVHDDHMGDFNTSKGHQDIYMSEETHNLLLNEFNADLVVRENLRPLRPHSPQQLRECKVSLIPSGHMPGAVQVLVETQIGRLGYSGDFAWPIEPENVMKCDALVVDSTYGSPTSTRQYTQDDAEQRLIELVLQKIRRGAVHVRAHRGTIQRAFDQLSLNVQAPILCSQRLLREISIYRQFGRCIGPAVSVPSPEATEAIRTGRYIRLYATKGDRFPQEIQDGVGIVLSAFMASPRDPVIEYHERAYRVAMSNHADFQGTIDYIRATGAKFVVTDNTRTYGVELAQEIRARLGVAAVPSSNKHTNEWGN